MAAVYARPSFDNPAMSSPSPKAATLSPSDAPLRLLALESSTDTLSVAVSNGQQVWQHVGAGGALASQQIIPLALKLLDQAGLKLTDLHAIAFGQGPGAFTGLRTACAVAQGLGFGSGVPLLPVNTLLAMAEQARGQLQRPAGVEVAPAPLSVLALLDARMGEVYQARWHWDGQAWQACSGVSVGPPGQVLAWEGALMAGNVFEAYGEHLPGGDARAEGPPADGPAAEAPAAFFMPRVLALPTAMALLRLAPALWRAGAAVAAEHAAPLYVRDKVAQTTAERAALRASTAVAAPTPAGREGP